MQLTDEEIQRAILLQEFNQHKKIAEEHDMIPEDILTVFNPELADKFDDLIKQQGDKQRKVNLDSLVKGDLVLIKINKELHPGSPPPPVQSNVTRHAEIVGVYANYVVVKLEGKKGHKYNYTINKTEILTGEVEFIGN